MLFSRAEVETLGEIPTGGPTRWSYGVAFPILKSSGIVCRTAGKSHFLGMEVFPFLRVNLQTYAKSKELKMLTLHLPGFLSPPGLSAPANFSF